MLHGGNDQRPTVWGTRKVRSLCWTGDQEAGAVAVKGWQVAGMGLHTDWEGSLGKAALWEGSIRSLNRGKESPSLLVV